MPIEDYTEEDFLAGKILLVDKPKAWSSFHAVNALKWAIRKKFNLKKLKIGHAGTLDPLATGLLLICVGKATKQIPKLQEQPKEYIGTFALGATTPSFDLETEVDATFATAHITPDKILTTAKEFLGQIQQVPPVYSAIKKEGKRLYEFARKGEQVAVPPRIVEIFEFEITRIELPSVDFRVVCSKGTYIRSLANDFGKALNSGAYLSRLRRTKIGGFHVNKAQTPQDLKHRLNGT